MLFMGWPWTVIFLPMFPEELRLQACTTVLTFFFRREKSHLYFSNFEDYLKH
jgi:hypothetical protein